MEDNVIQIFGLSKCYGDKKALNALDLTRLYLNLFSITSIRNAAPGGFDWTNRLRLFGFYLLLR
jgi:hypothetical protein